MIDALITTRILVQFIGQIVGADRCCAGTRPTCRGRSACGSTRSPNLVALVGWIFIFATSGTEVIAFGLGTLALGIVRVLRVVAVDAPMAVRPSRIPG